MTFKKWPQGCPLSSEPNLEPLLTSWAQPDSDNLGTVKRGVAFACRNLTFVMQSGPLLPSPEENHSSFYHLSISETSE